MEDRQLVPNVYEFLAQAAGLYGRWQTERFGQEMQANCLESGIASPIEDLFWIAFSLLAAVNYEAINPEPIIGESGHVLPPALYIKPQAQVGPYRVDFAILRPVFAHMQPVDPVVVELDGHAFHDKDKRQRAYEKARDRFLTRNGYRVLHFTGSEVVADPFRVAHEALSLLGVLHEEYDPADPLGTGN